MDDDATITTETENQQLTTNRNNNFPNGRMVIDSLRFQRVFNTTSFFKYLSLLIMIFIMFFVAALNKVHNVDYKKFNYTKNNLLQIYLNSIMDTMKTTFNDNNLIDLDQNLENSKSFDTKIEARNNFGLLQQIKENENLNKNERQETQILIKNNRHLTLRDHKFDNSIVRTGNFNSDDNHNLKNFLNEKISADSDDKNTKILFLENEKKTIKLNQMKSNIFLNPDQEDAQKYLMEKSSAASAVIDQTNLSSYVENSFNNTTFINNNKTNSTNESNKSDKNNESPEKINFNLGEVYYFMNNITQYEYSGKWNGCNPNNMFEQSEGAMSMEIRKNQSQHVFNVIPNIEFFRILEFTFNAKDGDYRDNWMVFNFTLKFPKDFHKNFLPNEEFESENTKSNNINKTVSDSNLKSEKANKGNKNKIVLVEDKVQIRYYIAELFETKNITQCNNSRVELEFIRAPIYKVENFDDINSIEFSKINGKITDPDCNFRFDFNLQIETEEDYSSRVWNYSLIITAISIAEIYLTYKLVIEISNNYQKGKNLCLVTVTLNLIWNASLCTGHFFLSLTQEDYSYEYGTPSMTYFLLFSIFELRLLFFTWKSRHNDLFYNDINQFRKKLFKFYSVFYVVLFVCLLSVKYIFSNVWTSLIYFGSTWFFQILHSALTGTKPPISLNYLICVSIGKLFPALYLKACPYNIFDLKPKYFIMFIITFIIVFQVVILEIQKFIGPKFILPKFMKKIPYNYYLSEKEEEDLTKSNSAANDCIICLDSLLNPNIELNPSLEADDLREIPINYKDLNCIIILAMRMKQKIHNYILSLKYTHARTKLMKTPCNHLFHNSCLEKWLEFKNECPYCRREIPPLE